MLKTQREILIAGALVAALMGIFPPWLHTFEFQSISQSKPAGYAFIATPPEPEYDRPQYGVRLDTSRLLVQWTVVVIATGAGMLLSLQRSGSQNVSRSDKK